MNHLTEPSTIISIAAFIISLLAYRQSLKLPNENKIFEEKIRVYHDLIKIMNEAINEIFGCINEFAENKKTKEFDEKELKDDFNDAIDAAIYSVEDAITDNSLVLPDKVVVKLTGFLELLDKDEYLDTYVSLEEFEKLDTTIEEAFNEAIDIMRKDLDFDILNKGLRKRIRGNNAFRILK